MVKVAYGKRMLLCDIPEGRIAGVVGKKLTRPGDVRRRVIRALSHPMGGQPLERLARGKRKILIVVPDSTRKAHLKEVLPLLLKRIDDGSREIRMMIATGMHARHTHEECAALVGRAVARKYNVASHSQEKGTLVHYGKTKSGVPVALNRQIEWCDLLITVGVVEPHLYAGYSGGVKTVAIGLAGEETISATHSVSFLDDPTVRLGLVKGNRFQDALQEIGAHAGIDFAVNMVNSPEGGAAHVLSGAPRAVFQEAIRLSKGLFEVHVDKAADIVLCGAGHPKDVNLYQASRALNYIANVDRPIVRKGGMIIVCAELKDGPGTSAAEKRFYDDVCGMRSPREFLARVKKDGCVAGEHRAYMVARVLADYRVAFVTQKKLPRQDELPFLVFGTVKGAVDHAFSITGNDATCYVVPYVLSTIAQVVSS